LNTATVLVFGGAGFIGRRFVEMLPEYRPGLNIVVADSFAYPALQEWDLTGSANLVIKHVDVQNPKIVQRTILDCDPEYIVNFAAETHNDRVHKNRPSAFLTNVYGVLNILESAKELKNLKRIVHVSTDEVYGEPKGGKPFKETGPLNPNTFYSGTKLMAEHVVRFYRDLDDLPVVVTRGSNTFGPGQYPEKLIPRSIVRVLNQKPMVIFGRGKEARQWIYVDDHASGIITVMLEHRYEPYSVYNIGGDITLTNAQVAKKIQETFKLVLDMDAEISFIEDPRKGFHDSAYLIDCTLLKSLGWEPTRDFDSGLEETIIWYNDFLKDAKDRSQIVSAWLNDPYVI